ncbi:MAG: signal peptidase II [Eubacteriales bacterium]|nr:signal peptidase II [Eubacteriales bacterium]
MNKKIIKKLLIFFISSTILIFFDQLSKHLATTNLKNTNEVYEFIKYIIYFVYHENRGAAFGILQEKYLFFYIITIVIILFILIYMFKLELKKGNILKFISLIFIFSGAIGNFIDRFFNKFVVDFIWLKYLFFDFPVFNFADICITVGVGLLFIVIIFLEKDNTKGNTI